MFDRPVKKLDNDQIGVFPVRRKINNAETIIGANIRAIFSSNLRRVRRNANLTQISLAEMADLAPNFINDIENGKKWVSPESLGRLAEALKIDPCLLFVTDPKWNNDENDMFSLFLSDIEKMSNNYRHRMQQENSEEKPNS